jgi:hypothetical protein
MSLMDVRRRNASADSDLSRAEQATDARLSGKIGDGVGLSADMSQGFA